MFAARWSGALALLAVVVSMGFATGKEGAATRPDPERFRSTSADRETISITVYNQNFGLVREVRDLDLARGTVALEFGDVASGIQPETVLLRPLGREGGLRVLEQNYQYDLLNPQKLLEKYVGRTVTVYRFDEATQREVPVQAEVLSVNGGAILRVNGEITFNYPGRYAFPDVPDNLIPSPTLVWLLQSDRSDQRVEASYLTSGLNWKADYVMVVDDDDTAADLTGWVTLTNQSGTDYRDAQLKLVAGDVQRVSQGPRPEAFDVLRAAAESDASGFQEQGFFEYHLYTLGRPATVLNNEQKQVNLLESAGFEVDKRLVYAGTPYLYRGQYGQLESNRKVGVYLHVRNSERNGLGMALPAGVIRVYKRDPSGAQQFIGEDRVDHTPRDEEVRIKLGESFDVVGSRTQTDWSVLSGCQSESAWKIELRNHKDRAETVTVMEPVGGDWEILSASHDWEKIDAATFRFTPRVPARESVELTYRVRVRWC